MSGPPRSEGDGGQSAADEQAIRRAKTVLRRAVQQRRAVRTEEQRGGDDAARFDQLRSFLSGSAVPTAACYLSSPPEPGTLQLIGWLAAQDVRVLLPVIGPPSDASASVGNPDWAPYAGPDRLRTSRLSLIEPDTDPVGIGALEEAAVIIVPGLAGNTAGHRLGRGGGWYDRALGHADPTAAVLMLLNDDEVVDVIPTHPWDRAVDVLVTPTRLLQCRR